jgi:NAD(P)H-flavin reductase
VAVTVDAAPRGWEGHVGLVTSLIDRLPITPTRATVFLCGPEVMIRVVARDLVGAGVDADRIFVSLERNMHCAIRQCGHCQLGPLFICADGPVVTWATAAPLLAVRRW